MAKPPLRDDAIILTCVPHRVATHELSDDGRVLVHQKRFGWAPLQRLMEALNRPHVRVRLDETGSFLWLRCDGSRSVETIARAGQQHFGDKLPDPQPRVVQFFRTLAQAGLVRLQRP